MSPTLQCTLFNILEPQMHRISSVDLRIEKDITQKLTLEKYTKFGKTGN